MQTTENGRPTISIDQEFQQNLNPINQCHIKKLHPTELKKKKKKIIQEFPNHTTNGYFNKPNQELIREWNH